MVEKDYYDQKKKKMLYIKFTGYNTMEHCPHNYTFILYFYGKNGETFLEYENCSLIN